MTDIRTEMETATEADMLRNEIEALRARVAHLETGLAECYRITGEDPDGNEDWRLANYAVAAVQALRWEADAHEHRVEVLTAAIRKHRGQSEAGSTVEERELWALLSDQEHTEEPA